METKTALETSQGPGRATVVTTTKSTAADGEVTTTTTTTTTIITKRYPLTEDDLFGPPSRSRSPRRAAAPPH